MVDDVQISVVMAVKNESRYINSALTSILAQQGVGFEVVVVDDHSEDDTFEQVTKLAESDDRLRLLRNPRKGKVAAFNTGVERARGRFVCLFAGDDIMPEGSLAARWDVVKDFNDGDQICGLYKIKTISEDKKFDGQVVPRAKGKGNFSGQSPLMSRPLVARIFPVPEELPNEDTWLAAALQFLPGITIFHSDVICCLWRMHSGNTYNMGMNFDDYRQRVVHRLRAYSLLNGRFDQEINGVSRDALCNMVAAIEHHNSGNVCGLILSSISSIEKLRLLRTINPFLYNLRRRYYKLFSGW